MSSAANAPDHRSGFRFRRAVGESLVRETRAFEKECGDVRLDRVRVSFVTRDGKMIVTCPLVDAMHAIQFNEPTVDGFDAREAFAVEVFFEG